MSNLFGGGSNFTQSQQRRQRRATDSYLDRATKQINTNDLLKGLGQASKDLDRYRRYGGKGPGYSFTARDGSVNLQRSPFTSAYFADLDKNRSTTDASYANLLKQIAPGHSAFRAERDRELALLGRKAHDDMKAQLAKRRVLGASFAQDQLAGVDAEYARQRDLARAESWMMELDQTKQVIGERSTAFMNNINSALSQLQFEGGLMATLSGQAQNGIMKLAEMQTNLAELSAKLKLEGQMAKAGIISNMGTSFATSLPGYAQMQNEVDAGQGAMWGSLFGLGGSILGGPIGAGIGGAMGLPMATPGTNTWLNN